jgi:hypothetical protein
VDQTDLIKETVRDWFSREGTKVETISNPRAEFLFKVKFHRFFFSVVRPNDQRFLQIESQVMISPQHQKLLSVEKMRSFQMEAMKFSFQQGLTMGFMQPRPGQPGPQPPGPGFIISDRIYDDAFTEDRLWRTMRKLHGAIDMVIALLNETTGQPIAKPDESTDAGPSYYT